MKSNLLIFFLACLFANCREPDGFTEGAFLQVQNGTKSDLEIVFDNDAGVKDSMFCLQDRITLIPIDMYSRRMNFALRDSSQRSLLAIDYDIIVRKQQKNLRVNLENIIAELDTAFNDHQFAIAEKYEQDTVSTVYGWQLTADDDWNFINNTRYVLHIE